MSYLSACLVNKYVSVLYRVGLSFTSFPYRTSVLALRSSTDFLKVWNTSILHHSRFLDVHSPLQHIQCSYFFFIEKLNLFIFLLIQCFVIPSLHMHWFAFLLCAILASLKSLCTAVFWVFISPGGKPVHWKFVHGLLESAIYGGHIDNPFDLRILRSYLEQFFNAQLLSSPSATQRKSRGEMSFFTPPISLPNSCILLVGVK